MELHQSQKLVASDRHRFRVVNCGRRFGKTTLAAYEMLGYAIAYEDARVPYYAPTRDDARDIIWRMLIDVAGEAIIDKNESRLELKIRNRFGGESLIVLYGWEAVQERGKGVGVKNNFIVLDEVAKYRNFQKNWDEILRPTLTDLRGDAMFISTPQGFNHFYELYNLQDVDDDYKSFHFTSYDNPFMPVDEIEKAKEQTPEDRFSQEYLADFRKTEGLVYKEFNRDEHLFAEPGWEGEDFVPVKTFAGVDFGFTNPAAIITIVKDKDANYWVTDEWYKTKQTDTAVADYVSAQKFNEVYPDPESPGAIEELSKRGCNVRDVTKGKDSVKNGIAAVRELFKANRLYISKNCTNLIWELETYSYPEKKPDHNEEEKPIKENDHALDALRYALSMENKPNKKTAHVFRPDNVGYNKPQVIKEPSGKRVWVRR